MKKEKTSPGASGIRLGNSEIKKIHFRKQQWNVASTDINNQINMILRNGMKRGVQRTG